MSDTKIISNTRELHELGTFEIVSGKVRISDPCYDKKTWCAGSIDNVLTGTWKAQVIKKSETYKYKKKEDWNKGKIFSDNRNVLIAVHESFNSAIHTDKRKVAISGGMDAGLAGIFDDKFYKKDYKEEYVKFGEAEYYKTQDLWRAKNDIKRYKELMKTGNKEMKWFYESSIQQAKDTLAGKFSYEPKVQVTKDWYEICCDKSLSNMGAGVIRNGVVSSSGYGDGGYRTFAVYDANSKVVGIKLIF